MTDIKSWRDVLPVHPAADLFPMMSEAELRELGEDIKANGLKSDLILWSPGTRGDKGSKRFVLDDRNRLAAIELVGASELIEILENLNRGPFGSGGCWYYHLYENDRDGVTGPYIYALSANIHRRHLTSEQKRELIANVLKAKPEQSNNAIAKQTKTDDKMVARFAPNSNQLRKFRSKVKRHQVKVVG